MQLITTKELRTLHIATRHHHTINSQLAVLRSAQDYGFKGAARRFGLGSQDRSDPTPPLGSQWARRIGAAPSGEAPPTAVRRDRTAHLAGSPRPAVGGDADAHLAQPGASYSSRHRDDSPDLSGPRLSPHPAHRSASSTSPHSLQQGATQRVCAGRCQGGEDRRQKYFQYTALDDCTRYRVLGCIPASITAPVSSFWPRSVKCSRFPFARYKLIMAQDSHWPLPSPRKKLAFVSGISSHASPNRVERWNAVIASTRKNFGVARRSTGSRQRPRRRASVQPRPFLHGLAGPDTRGGIDDILFATNPIITNHAMHTNGGRCLTSHYTGTANRKLAEQICAETLLEVQTEEYFPKLSEHSKTFGELIERYMPDHSAIQKKPKSHRRDKSLKAHLVSAFGPPLLVEISSAQVAADKTARPQAGASARTVNRELGLARHAFNLAIREWQRASHNPFAMVRSETGPKGGDRWLRDEEEALLLATCPRWLEELVEMALETGMRLGELLGLERQNVDLVRKVIYVEAGTAKNTLSRSIPLSARTVRKKACGQPVGLHDSARADDHRGDGQPNVPAVAAARRHRRFSVSRPAAYLCHAPLPSWGGSVHRAASAGSSGSENDPTARASLYRVLATWHAGTRPALRRAPVTIMSRCRPGSASGAGRGKLLR